MAEAVYA